MQGYLKKHQEIGILLIIFGVTVGNLLYEFLGKSINIVNISMFLGVILIGDYRRLLSLKWPYPKIDCIIIFIFQNILLLYLIAYCNQYLKSGFVDFSYVLFVLVLIVMINSNGYSVRMNNLVNYLFYFSFFILLLISFVIFRTGFSTRFTFTSGADPLAMGLGITSCLATILIYNPTSIYKKVIKFMSIFLFIYCELAFNCRTAIVSSILIILINIIQNIRIGGKKNLNLKKFFNTFFKILSLIVLIYTIYTKVAEIKILIDTTIEFIGNGIKALYMGEGYGVDASANTRLITRREALRIISSSNLFQLLFGHGYMKMYVDIPILQAFLDLGIIGGSVYFYIIFIIPLKLIVSRQYINLARRDNEYKERYLLFTLLSLPIIIKQFGSATPYGHDLYWPSTLCLFILVKNKKSLKNNMEENYEETWYENSIC